EGVATATVTVRTVRDGVENLINALLALARSRALGRGEASALTTALNHALVGVPANGTGPLKNILDAFIARMQSLPRTDRFTDADADALIATAIRIKASTGLP
ncbi:MAG: hypothetical protein ABIW79_09930, partial [Gemmatimonas sp.]